MQFSSISCVNRPISGTTTLSQSGPGSDGNEEVLCILQSSSITGASPSDCLGSYRGHSLGNLRREAVGVFCSPSWLDGFAQCYKFSGSQPLCQQHRSGWVCLITGHTLSLRGPSSQALTLFGGVRFIAWRLRHPFLGECQWGPRHFGDCQACLGYGPAAGPTLKKALRHTHPVGGTADKYCWHDLLQCYSLVQGLPH